MNNNNHSSPQDIEIEIVKRAYERGERLCERHCKLIGVEFKSLSSKIYRKSSNDKKISNSATPSILNRICALAVRNFSILVYSAILLCIFWLLVPKTFESMPQFFHSPAIEKNTSISVLNVSNTPDEKIIADIHYGYRIFYFRNIIKTVDHKNFFDDFLKKNGVTQKDLYINSKYGYSLYYPEKKLIMLGESDLGDGNNFVSYDGKTYISVYASHDDEEFGLTLSDIYKNQSIGATYKKKHQNWFVVSRLNGDSIVYKKFMKSNGKIVGFELRYPLEDKDYWDGYLLKLNSHITVF
ncbi:hypothetical protein [Vibrio misgurnus]|uniref:hypothetical protein n=1 Tax=Vibrio misgurnus TaxID=2993714 RepID=UPI0023F7E339|nr:hypothetical protein [Vibrio sp. VCS]